MEHNMPFNDTILLFSLHHPDLEPMETCEQKFPVIQYFDMLAQIVMNKQGFCIAV